MDPVFRLLIGTFSWSVELALVRASVEVCGEPALLMPAATGAVVAGGWLLGSQYDRLEGERPKSSALEVAA